ncbi:nucleotidyltransferase family protein [Marinilabilia sp.]|uniref:nucleotidyltransferase family protein n=1 Tax=Marinilabilia sp. TaxID=2021252 RepID=UPI0025C5659B|nr:nucleotidyltransferase family protein [Marinilabilia sp.]
MVPFQTEEANLIFEIASFRPQLFGNRDLNEEGANKAYRFAARNGLVPWIYYKLNSNDSKGVQWPDSIQQAMRMQYLQTLVMNQQKWKVFREIRELANAEGIQVIPLKGTALAFSLYPEEALRPMGDLDILVPPHQVYDLRDLLLNKGAKPLHVPISDLHDKVHAHISALTWQNIMIEPHQRLFALGSVMNLKDIDLFQHTQKIPAYPEVQIFEDRMQAYHLSTHAFKGYKMGGMRLGWLLDIALILQSNQRNNDFIPSVLALNPKAKKEILAPFQWASLLLNEEPATQLEIPFPDEILFHEEQEPGKKHKTMVAQEIMGLPGIHNKAKMLFREFFPQKSYMDYQYGKHRGTELLKLYLKRIAGLSLPENR